VILITTSGQLLVWDAYDISVEKSKTENIIKYIESLISEVDEKYINIKAFISNSAGKYTAAQYDT